jgi:hypothetical protein
MSLSKPVKEAAAPRPRKEVQLQPEDQTRRAPGDQAQLLVGLGWHDARTEGVPFKIWCNFQDLESMIPDPLRLLDIAGYIQYVMPILRPEELADITEENDPLGIRKSTILLWLWRAENGKAVVG